MAKALSRKLLVIFLEIFISLKRRDAFSYFLWKYNKMLYRNIRQSNRAFYLREKKRLIKRAARHFCIAVFFAVIYADIILYFTHPELLLQNERRSTSVARRNFTSLANRRRKTQFSNFVEDLLEAYGPDFSSHAR